MSLKSRLKYIKSNKTLVNGTLFSLYSFFGQGVSFVLLIILAHYIMPNEYGLLSLFSTVTSVLGLVFGLSSSGYVSVVFFNESRTEFNKDFTCIFIINIITVLIYFVALISAGPFISKLLSLPLDVLYLAGFIVLFNKLYQFQQDLHRLKEELKIFGVLSCSNAILNFLTAIFFVVYLNWSWIGRIYSLVTYSAIFAIISIIYLVKEKYFDLHDIKKRFVPILKWSLPLIPHLAANWIKQGLDRYIINDSYTSYDVGIFSFALNLTSVIITIGVAFNNSNSVTLYQILSSNTTNAQKRNEIDNSVKEFLYIYLFISCLVVAGGSILTPIIFPNYSMAVPYFIILGVYGFLQCVYFLYCNIFFYYKNTRELMYITFFSALLHLGLSLLLTKYSLYLTAIIYLVSIGVVDLLVIKLGRKMMLDKLTDK